LETLSSTASSDGSRRCNWQPYSRPLFAIPAKFSQVYFHIFTSSLLNALLIRAQHTESSTFKFAFDLAVYSTTLIE
jgi:hypothetical protein